MSRHAWGALLLGGVLLAGCGGTPDPARTPEVESSEESTPGESGPTAAREALDLIPAEATEVSVTDFVELRDSFDAADLDSTSDAGPRERFYRQVLTRSATLTPGLLRPVDEDLRTTYGFSQDDVAWEARFRTPTGSGWILEFTDAVSMEAVQDAVDAEVAPLSGGTVDTVQRRVAGGAVADPSLSLSADPDVVGLLGITAVATYLSLSCVDSATALAATPDRLPTDQVEALALLQPLDAFSITFGPSLATVRLGTGRSDLQARLALMAPPASGSRVLAAFAGGATDAQGGRIGFDLAEPATAAALTLERRLPFAACP